MVKYGTGNEKIIMENYLSSIIKITPVSIEKEISQRKNTGPILSNGWGSRTSIKDTI